MAEMDAVLEDEVDGDLGHVFWTVDCPQVWQHLLAPERVDHGAREEVARVKTL
jgi:hypothetical protein